MTRTRVRAFQRRLAIGVVSSAMLAGTLLGVGESPASATVSSVKGSACAYITNVGLFGGPQAKLGCAPQAGNFFAPASATTLAPSVELPADGTGSATAITASDIDGARAKYGPATIHGGIWPDNVATPTASGPQHVSTQGTPGDGSVTSSADITLKTPPYPTVPCETGFSPPCEDPGGFGPPPVWGDSLHAECTASESGVAGSTTFSNAKVAKATDSGGSPLPSSIEAIPDNPPVNYTRSGVISNVGDVFTVVFNQQIVNADGSLTVNAVHMYLFGPVAVGEVIRGQVTCGTTPSPLTPTDTVLPHCGIAVVAPVGPEDPTPKEPYTELVGTFDAGGLQSVTNVQIEHGTVSIGQPGSPHAYLQFTPGQTGPLPITAVRDSASESAGLPMTWSFDITDAAGNTSHCSGVIPPRPPGSPLAYNDYYSTLHDATLSQAIPGVLVNDTDPENDALSAALATNPTNGAVTFSPDGSFDYDPNPGFAGDDSFEYTIDDGNGGTDTGRVTITVGQPPPTLSIGDVSVHEGKAGTRMAVFTVSLSKFWDSDVTVDYATADGSATAPADYTTKSGTLTFTPGTTSLTVKVPVVGDTADDDGETFSLVLSGATVAIVDGSGTGTIIDDDPVTVGGRRLAIGDVSVYEGQSGAQFAVFTVSLDQASASTVKVDYTAFAATATKWEDYIPSKGTLTFAPGVTSKTIQVFIMSDENPEGDQTFKMKLSGAYGASLADASGLGTIIDDDGGLGG